MKLEFLGRFSKNTQISNFIKIRPVGAELFHADGGTDMTKLTVAFRNFAHAPISVKLSRYTPSSPREVGTSVALHILNPNIVKGWVVSDMPRPFYTPGSKPGTHGTSK
jgi:hypothetical protein